MVSFFISFHPVKLDVQLHTVQLCLSFHCCSVAVGCVAVVLGNSLSLVAGVRSSEQESKWNTHVS